MGTIIQTYIVGLLCRLNIIHKVFCTAPAHLILLNNTSTNINSTQAEY